MGVDSGMPDFRGNKGFWKAFPALTGVPFTDMAQPHWFESDPAKAWGFYGYRRNMYRHTEPHEGFALLQRWAEGMEHGLFVFTSNVDGQFQKSGVPENRVCECHGSIHFNQCSAPCRGADGQSRIVPADGDPDIPVDQVTMRTTEDALPRCSNCEAPMRPNILMFGDYCFIDDRTHRQYEAFDAWLEVVHGSQRDSKGASLVIVEMGAGSAVPTVRRTSESVAASTTRASLIRINPREPEIPSHAQVMLSDTYGAVRGLDRGIELPLNSFEALRKIDHAMRK